MRNALLSIVVLGIGVGIVWFEGCSSSAQMTRAGGADAGVGARVDAGVALIKGKVVDSSGAAIAGASLKAGKATASAAKDGTFSLSVPPGPVIVTASATGHVDSFKAVTASTSAAAYLPITLAARSAAVTLDADRGGTAQGPRGATLVAPAGAFVDAQTGAKVTGTVSVALTPLDPSVAADLAAYPGQLVAEQGDGGKALLESMGVVEIDAEQNGARLTVKPGLTMKLTLPAPANATPLASAELWSFDEATTLWKDEGTAAALDAASNTYGASIRHLSWFNLDMVAPVGCVKGRTVDCKGERVRGILVMAESTERPALGTDTSDVNGLFSVPCILGVTMTLDFLAPAGPMVVVNNVVNGTTEPAKMSNAGWASGYISKDDPACRELGDVIVGTGCKDGLRTPDAGTQASPGCFGVAVGDGGARFDAAGGGASTVWEGACFKGLESIFTCWSPSGSCKIRISTSGAGGTIGMTLTYANGAKMVWTENEVSGTSTGTMDSPTGQVCGTMSTVGTTTTLTGAGKSWRFTPVGNNGETVTCPDGTTQTLTDSQMQSMGGCSAMSGSGGGGGCSQQQLGSCDTDADCSYMAGLGCCVTKGGNICLDTTSPTACLEMQLEACATDADCTNAAMPTCCPSGLINMCMPSCS